MKTAKKLIDNLESELNEHGKYVSRNIGLQAEEYTRGNVPEFAAMYATYKTVLDVIALPGTIKKLRELDESVIVARLNELKITHGLFSFCRKTSNNLDRNQIFTRELLGL